MPAEVTAPPAHSSQASRAGFVVIGSALFGTVGTARVLGPDASAAAIGALRLLLAAALLVWLSRATVPTTWSGLRQSWRMPAVWVAGLAQAAFNLTFLAAVVHAGVAIGTLVAIGCTPILTGLLSRHVTPAWLGATGFALVGLVALLSDGFNHGVTLVGVAWAVGASASYAAYILSSSALLSAPVDTTTKIAAIFVVAAGCLAPALLWVDLGWTSSAGGIAMVVYMAVVPTVLAYSFFNRGLAAVTPGTAATLGLTEPLVAALLGVFVLDEQLSLVGWLGAAIVLVGLAVMIAVSRPERPALQT